MRTPLQWAMVSMLCIACNSRNFVFVDDFNFGMDTRIADATEDGDVRDSSVVMDITDSTVAMDIADAMDVVDVTDVRLEAATEAPVCATGETLCGAACVNIVTSSAHCGGCGQTCDLAHAAMQRCSASTCSVIACDPGWNNCDMMNNNGCELSDGCGSFGAMVL
jgi:hypothetical protein